MKQMGHCDDALVTLMVPLLKSSMSCVNVYLGEGRHVTMWVS